MRSQLRAGDYDAVIDLQGAVRSAVVGRLAGCPAADRRGRAARAAARWLFTERVATHGAHVIEQDVELASAVAGDALIAVRSWLPVDAAAEAWGDAILASSGTRPVVLINPGAGWGAKRWPVERYAAVARGLIERGFRVLVNAGPGEESLADAIVKGTSGAATPLATSLAQLIALTRRIALCVAGDTGPLHLACALGRPVVGIYGPTDPSRNGPFGTRFRVLRSPLKPPRPHPPCRAGGRIADHPAGRRAARRRELLGRGEGLMTEQNRLLQNPAPRSRTGSPAGSAWPGASACRWAFLTAALYLFELVAARAPAGRRGLEPGAGAARPVAARLRRRLREKEPRADHDRPLRPHPQPALPGIDADRRGLCPGAAQLAGGAGAGRRFCSRFMCRSSPRRSASCAPHFPDSTTIAAACPA